MSKWRKKVKKQALHNQIQANKNITYPDTWLESMKNTNSINLDGNFANAVISSFNDHKRRHGIDNIKGKVAEYERRNIQRSIMNATKFFVDDELLEHAVAASFVAPKDLLIAMETAIPPVDNMWIEWNEHQRLKIAEKWHHKLGLDLDGKNYEEGSANYMGYHITKNGKNHDTAYKVMVRVPSSNAAYDEDSYLYSSYYLFNNKDTDKKVFNKISFQHFGFAIKNNDPICFPLKNPDLIKYNSMFFGPLYEEFYKKTPEKYFDELHKKVVIAPHEGLAILMDPVYEWGSKQEAKEWYLELMEANVISSAGDARFIASVIALLNYPNLVKKRNAKAVKHQKMWGSRLPTNEVKTIEIDLPKPRGVSVYSKMYKGIGSPKRYHLRRGHFNHYRLKDGSIIRKWIGPKYVGNESLGTIEHEYKLTSTI